jgi:hypothetical protein
VKDTCYPGDFYSDSNPKTDKFYVFVTDPKKTDFNAPDRAIQFINYINYLGSITRDKNIMLPMGCDYTYENAGQNYKKMEEMI